MLNQIGTVVPMIRICLKLYYHFTKFITLFLIRIILWFISVCKVIWYFFTFLTVNPILNINQNLYLKLICNFCCVLFSLLEFPLLSLQVFLINFSRMQVSADAAANGGASVRPSGRSLDDAVRLLEETIAVSFSRTSRSASSTIIAQFTPCLFAFRNFLPVPTLQSNRTNCIVFMGFSPAPSKIVV